MYISPQSTDAEWELGHNGEAELLVQCVLTEGPQEARVALNEYLQGYELPVDQVLRVKRDTSRLNGSVVLETIKQKPPFILLWVYGNVFVRITQLGPKSKSNIDSFYRWAEGLFQYIIDGAVETKRNVTVPVISDADGPKQVTVGDRFEVKISLEGKPYDDISCNTGVSYNFA